MVKVKGFSLIEILVVVTLMGLLMAGATVYIFGQLEQGRMDTAKSQAYEIAKALDLYRLRFGNYPSTSEGLEVLVNPPSGQPLMTKLPQDPWKNEYNYQNPGTYNKNGVDVWSSGPSGNDDSETMIGNWDE